MTENREDPIHPFATMQEALADARRRAKQRGNVTEYVLTSALVPVLREWIDKQPVADTQGRPRHQPTGNDFMAQLAHAARVPPRRLFGLLHGEDITVSLDVADRLMMAINEHISLLEDAIISSLEADLIARYQRVKLREWWESIGNEWPKPGADMRRRITPIRRSYFEAHNQAHPELV